MATLQVLQMMHEDEFGCFCPSAPPPSPEIPIKRNFFPCVNLNFATSSNYKAQDDGIDVADIDSDDILFPNSSGSFPSSLTTYPIPRLNVDFGRSQFSASVGPTSPISFGTISYSEQSNMALPEFMGRIHISDSPTKRLCPDSQSLPSSCGKLCSKPPNPSPPPSPLRKRKISAHRHEGNFSFSPSPSIDADLSEMETSEKKRCILSDDHSSFNEAKQQLMRRRNAVAHIQLPFQPACTNSLELPETFNVSLNNDQPKPPLRKNSNPPFFSCYGQFLNIDHDNSMDTSVTTISRSL